MNENKEEKKSALLKMVERLAFDTCNAWATADGYDFPREKAALRRRINHWIQSQYTTDDQLAELGRQLLDNLKAEK